MSRHESEERRRHGRYASDFNLSFYVTFDVEAKLDFRVKKDNEQGFSRARYSGTSKNVSAEGICFVTNQELCKRDFVAMEIHLPNQTQPVAMTGRVRWSRAIEEHPDRGKRRYDTGVKLISCNGEAVDRTVIFDEIHRTYWSIVLESFLGETKHLLLRDLPGQQ